MGIREVLHHLNEGADQDLGSIVGTLDGSGSFDEADILESAGLRYELHSEWMDGMAVVAVLSIDPMLLTMFSAEARDRIEDLLRDMTTDIYVKFEGLVVRPLAANPDWRELRQAARDPERGRAVHNQGSYKPVSSLKRRDGLNFGSDEEIAVYEALRRKQKLLPPESTIGILPGCAIRAAERTFWPDFLITYRHRAGVIEVDGPHHHGRAVADHSRASQMADAGLALVDRIAVEDTIDSSEVDIFVERFLQRLLR